LIAEVDGERVGLLTYAETDGDLEVVSLDALLASRGVGTALLEAASELATAHRCRRIWLITTNDNLPALGFYQRRGFRLVALWPGALDAARLVKPEIPGVGRDGIALHDEIELALDLVPDDPGRGDGVGARDG
jgi:predicted N-acetyltransferase YhbS